ADDRSGAWHLGARHRLAPELAQCVSDVRPAKQQNGLVERAPAIVVVLPVQSRLEARRRLCDEARDGDPLGSRRPLGSPDPRLFRGGVAVLVAHRPQSAGSVEVELFAELAQGGLLGILTGLERTRGGVPVTAERGTAVKDEELLARAPEHEDLHLLGASHTRILLAVAGLWPSGSAPTDERSE